MGDRCYMQLTCRRTDRSVFEEIGFGRESDFDDPNFPDCVEMIDLEANYAHASDLPTNVVYMGTHDAGYEYGPEAFACDGEAYLEQASDSEGGFVVWFDESGESRSAKSNPSKNLYHSPQQGCGDAQRKNPSKRHR